MTEKERYIPKWEKGKIIGAKDTELHLTLNVKIMIRELNGQNKRIKELEQELKRCREWINSDKNDYELTLAFIKNKGFSLQDVLDYEKTLKKKVVMWNE